MKNRFWGVLTAAALAVSAVPSFGVSAADDIIKNEHEDGTLTEGWNLSSQGSIQLEDGKDGGFEGKYTDTVDCLFGSGMNYEQHENRTVSEMGEINVTYDAAFEGSDFRYCGLECWVKEPQTAFYVIEGYNCDVPFRLPGNVAPEKKPELLKTVEIDGHKYDLYQTDAIIILNEIAGEILRYKLYWSVRQDNAMKDKTKGSLLGTISLDEHFRAWESIGADCGNRHLSSAEFLMEFWADDRENPSSGTCKAEKVLFETANGAEVSEKEPVLLYQETFEESTGLWRMQNSQKPAAKLERDAKNYAEGGHSLHVNCHNDNAYADLSDISLDINKIYIIQAAVMQNSAEEAAFRLEANYKVDNSPEWTDSDGTDGVPAWSVGGGISGAAETCKKGEWTVLTFRFRLADAPGLANYSTETEKLKVSEFGLSVTPFIPSETEEIVEEPVPDTVSEYWIDSITIAEAGTNVGIDLSGAVTEGKEPVPGTDHCKICTGDANCDGFVDVSDAVLVLRYISEDTAAQMSSQGKDNGDVNRDGRTDDTSMILQYIARKITF